MSETTTFKPPTTIEAFLAGINIPSVSFTNAGIAHQKAIELTREQIKLHYEQTRAPGESDQAVLNRIIANYSSLYTPPQEK